MLSKGFHAWRQAGVVIVPTGLGTKHPACQWQSVAAGAQPPSDAWIVQQLESGRSDGLFAVCGKASGSLEVLECDCKYSGSAEIIEAGLATLETMQPALWGRIANGCVEQSPGGGTHYFFRVSGGLATSSQVLAKNPAGNTVWETRGQGAGVVVAPSPARAEHAAGSLPYAFVGNTSPAGIPNITCEERDTLYGCLRAICLHRTEDKQAAAAPPRTSTRCTGGIGHEFTSNTSWHDILLPLGWACVGEGADGRTRWVRPGKDASAGISATTGGDEDCLTVFSTSTDLDSYSDAAAGRHMRGYKRFSAWVHLRHGGDFTKAAAIVHQAKQLGLSWRSIARKNEGVATVGKAV